MAQAWRGLAVPGRIERSARPSRARWRVARRARVRASSRSSCDRVSWVRAKSMRRPVGLQRELRCRRRRRAAARRRRSRCRARRAAGPAAMAQRQGRRAFGMRGLHPHRRLDRLRRSTAGAHHVAAAQAQRCGGGRAEVQRVAPGDLREGARAVPAASRCWRSCRRPWRRRATNTAVSVPACVRCAAPGGKGASASASAGERAAIDHAAAQALAPEGLEARIVLAFATPLAAHQFTAVARLVIEHRCEQLVDGARVVQRRDHRLDQRCAAIEGTRIAPLFVDVAHRQVPSAALRGLVGIQARGAR